MVGLNNPLGGVSPDPFFSGLDDELILYCIEQEEAVGTNVDPERVLPDPLQDCHNDKRVRHCLEELSAERDTFSATVVNGLDNFDDNGDANYPIVRQKLIDIALRMDLIEPQHCHDQLIMWSLSHGDIQHYWIVPFMPLNQPQPMATTSTRTKPAMVGYQGKPHFLQ